MVSKQWPRRVQAFEPGALDRVGESGSDGHCGLGVREGAGGQRQLRGWAGQRGGGRGLWGRAGAGQRDGGGAGGERRGAINWGEGGGGGGGGGVWGGGGGGGRGGGGGGGGECRAAGGR